jgi:hypothetical protein
MLAYLGVCGAKYPKATYDTMAKPRQLKPWPELIGLLPLLKAEEPRLRESEVGHLDLENVFDVDSLGLAIYLAKLAQFVSHGHPELYLSLPINQHAAFRLESLDFQTLLNKIGKIRTYEDMFSFPPSAPLKVDANSDMLVFEEVIHVRAVGLLQRDMEISRIKKKIKDFLNKDTSRKFAHQQIMVVLLELVKNTLDHSTSDAYLGLKITDNRFSFNYADTGAGIVSSVRKYWNIGASKLTLNGELVEATRIGRLSEKGAFADFIQWALKPGNSTKIGNGINFGFGLMMIMQASKNCGIRLAIRDADTYLVLTQPGSKENSSIDSLSHAFVRQRGVTTSAPPLLLFHGVLDFFAS